MESAIIESIAVGGPIAILATIIFSMYRRDRLSTEKMWRESKKFTDELIGRDQETREDNTKALTELNILLRKMNGRK